MFGWVGVSNTKESTKRNLAALFMSFPMRFLSFYVGIRMLRSNPHYVTSDIFDVIDDVR